MSYAIQFEALWQHLTGRFHSNPLSIHGPAHWHRVERNGVLLATRTGANSDLVRLFAMLHDSCRTNDGWDDGHGARAADHAATLRGKFFTLSDEDFAALHYACTWHTDGLHHEDPTIGTCWDADRLDLGRVSIIPHPKFMSTAFGREIAEKGSIQPFISPAVESAWSLIEHASSP
jgi:uncharacterized protein